MGLSKNKGTSVLNSSKITLNSSPSLAWKDDKIPLTSGLINRVFYEHFIRKNEHYREVPSMGQLHMDRAATGLSCPMDSRPFCRRCNNSTFYYPVDFLHEVRAKMYGKPCTCCKCWEYCPFESEALPENQFNLRCLLNEGYKRNASPSPKLSASSRRREERDLYSNGIASSSKPTSQDKSEEEVSQKHNNARKVDLVNRSKEQISPRAPRSFKTLHRTWSDDCWDQLSLSIWHKFDATKQTEQTFRKKMNLWEDLYRTIQKIPRLPKFELFLMGSTISGFGMEGSDIDMCVVAKDGPMYCDQRTEALENLLHVKQFLEKMPSNLDNISLICAKVPILRFKQNMNDIDIEVSLNNYVGIRNTQLLHCYAQLDWRVRPLVVVVKLWAKHHNLNNPRNCTISSYSLVLMVINFLQCGVTPSVLPCLHKLYPEKFLGPSHPDDLKTFERVEPFPTDNNDTLGSLLINFLKYYTKFDYANNALSVRTGTVIPVKECSWKRNSTTDDNTQSFLNIEEPFNLTNTGKSVHNGYIFAQIKTVFATSWRALEDGQDLGSIFGKTTFPTPTHSSVNTSYY